MGGLHSKRINYMKEEGKKQAEVNYSKLLQQQVKEYEHSISTTKENVSISKIVIACSMRTYSGRKKRN